jgi:hypothetical protein
MNKKRIFILIFLVSCVLLILLFLKPLRAAVKTTLLLSEYSQVIFDKHSPRPLLFLTKAPNVKKITINTEKGPMDADLYLPANISGRKSAVVYVFGITDTFYGPRLVQSAEAMARIGVVTLVPHLSNFVYRRLIEDGVIDQLTDSFRYLEKQNFVDSKKIGFVSFCVGGSLALIASSDPKIAGQVNFVGAISPYYDLTSLEKAVFTNRYRLNNKDITWTPNIQTLGVSRREILSLSLLPIIDRMIILNGFRTNKLPAGQFNKLSTRGKMDWQIFTFKDRVLTDRLLDEFFHGIGKEAHDSFSPSKHIDGLKAPVFLTTATGDKYIPLSESDQLAQALQERNKEVHFTRSGILDHTLPTKKLPPTTFLIEVVKIWILVYDMVMRIS